MKRIIPADGQERIKYKFLFFPLTVGNEQRWLERVKVLQKYSYGNWAIGQGWHNKKFIDF
ncbi:MAG: hypothetical protein GY936_14255 [Ignavibacteriae bacterium]|nr:hypothetical protein [Ignavibacteriota bacterium]